MPRGLHHVVHGAVEILAEQDEFLRALPRAGNVFLHFVREFLRAEGHRIILEIGIVREDRAERVFHGAPFEPDAQIVEQCPYRTGLFLASEIAQLMERRLKLKPPTHKAGGKAAGHVVLLDQSDPFPLLRQPRGCRQTAVSGADDYGIVFFYHGNSSFMVCDAWPDRVSGHAFADQKKIQSAFTLCM